MKQILVSITLFFAPFLALAGEPWPAWRGPLTDGVSHEKVEFPIHWSPTENVAWKTPLPGVGHSSPIVWNDRVFVTACVEPTGERLLLCIDAKTGKILWQKEVLTAKLEKKHKLNSYASSTPATDGKNVWVTFFDQPFIRVACYDFDGNRKWTITPGRFNSPHGFCSSPILYKNLLIVNCDQDNQEAFIVALDKNTGKEIYRIDRPNQTRSYCVPIIVEAAGRKQMVLSGSKCVASYDPDSGKQIWIIQGPTEQFVANMVYTDDVFFITGGFPQHHVLGIKPDGHGDVTDTHILWRSNQATSYVPSPIAYQDLFFLISDEGIASCFEPKTGERYWKERLGRHFSASLTAAGGHVYFLDDDGRTTVVKADKTFQVVARSDLKEECYASPALSGGRIFIRTAKSLYCIGAAK